MGTLRNIRRTSRKVQRAAWRVSSVAGDVSAVTRGPGAVGKRIVRKAAYRTTGRALNRLLRSLGL
jgi:hypothetical protein